MFCFSLSRVSLNLDILLVGRISLGGRLNPEMIIELVRQPQL